MTLARKAFKGALWLGSFRLATQIFSWGTTIIIARLLAPKDYGLMEMTTLVTGYVAVFSELGLGAAIIQREKVRNEELSSLFWLTVSWGVLLAFICCALAYPAAAVFDEVRILRPIQSLSLLFIIGSASIVPLSMMNRDLRFKAIGFVEAVSVFISCLAMVGIARSGGGIWTLIGGSIVKETSKAILLVVSSFWRPMLHFRFQEIRSYLKFGLYLAGANSLHYFYSKSDKFFGGRALGAGTLGYYSLAFELSAAPADKLAYLINNVSFPILSRCQKELEEFNQFYLKLVNLIAFATFPLFIGGIFLADQLIPFVLGRKWAPIILPFKLLCIAQIVIAITTPNAYAHNAQNRPHWGLYLSLVNAAVLPLSFSIASRYGLYALAIPWITINPLIRCAFTRLTLRKLGISPGRYMSSLLHPLLATASMLAILFCVRYLYFGELNKLFIDPRYYLLIATVAGAFSFCIYLFIFQRPLLHSIADLGKS